MTRIRYIGLLLALVGMGCSKDSTPDHSPYIVPTPPAFNLPNDQAFEDALGAYFLSNCLKQMKPLSYTNGVFIYTVTRSADPEEFYSSAVTAHHEVLNVDLTDPVQRASGKLFAFEGRLSSGQQVKYIASEDYRPRYVANDWIDPPNFRQGDLVCTPIMEPKPGHFFVMCFFTDPQTNGVQFGLSCKREGDQIIPLRFTEKWW